MINLLIGDTKCNIPCEWNEINLKDYSKIYSIIRANPFIEPDESKTLNEAENKSLDLERALHNMKTNRKVFSCLTNINESIIDNVDAKEMNDTLLLMTNFLNSNVEKMVLEDGAKQSFEYKKVKYFYPVAEMKKSTFGDYIEAAQLDMLSEKNEAGRFGVIAEQMAILCRELNEVYDEEKVQKKTKMFENLTMDIVWGFVFFLNRQTNTYKKHIQTSSNQELEMTTDMPQIIGKS